MAIDASNSPMRRKRRVRTPTVLQMEAVECGAAALAIVLGHYGRYVPLEELRVICGVSRDGSTAKNVVRAARHYGLQAKGFRRGLDSIQNERCPIIVFWNFNHFLVVEGFRGDTVYLNDPASGPRKVTLAEFDDGFTGVVLTFEPGPAFAPGGQPAGVLASLLGRLSGGGGAIALTVLFSLMLVVPGIIVPGFSKIFVDDFLIQGSTDFIRPLLLGLGLTTLVQGLLVWLQQRYLLRIETKLALVGSAKFIWHVLRLPAVFFTQRQTGDISNRVASNDQIAVLLSGDLGTSMVNLIVIAFYIVVMVTYDPVLTGIGVTLAVINLVAFSVVNRKRTDISHKLQEEQSKVISTAIAGISTIESIKATGAEDSFFARWAGYQTRSINTQQRIDLLNNILGILPPFLAAANTAVILGLGGFRVVEGAMTIGTLVAFQALMQMFQAPIQQLMGVGDRLTAIKADLARINDVHKYPEDPRLRPDTPEIEGAATKLSGRVELRDVSFGYSPLDTPLIEGFNLILEPGSRVALVGGSGSGKSTVAKLVTGLYRPWSGQVLFDGVEADAVPLSVISSSLASVDQEIFLFAGSIRDNLTMWDRGIPDAWMTAAAKDAAIHDDIAARPGGYDAALIEGGGNLSGGQRQRLEIARALVTQPTILVLDEATSALDTVTEEAVDANLRRRGCTCLIVAHRLSTIRDCDEIIVLDGGKVADRGTHDALIETSAIYRRLIEN
jgi:NHLM bacteriocin system ABC transporter peptidase/ATP-binding protein